MRAHRRRWSLGSVGGLVGIPHVRHERVSAPCEVCAVRAACAARARARAHTRHYHITVHWYTRLSPARAESIGLSHTPSRSRISPFNGGKYMTL